MVLIMQARTTTALGNFTSATTANTFASNAGVSAINIGMRVPSASWQYSNQHPQA